MDILKETIKVMARKVRREIFKQILPLRVKNIKKQMQGNVITVIFIAQYPEMWNSTKSVYEYMKNNSHFKVIILAIPKKKSGDGVTIKFFEENEMYNFLINEGESVINAFAQERWIDIQLLKPDYIFLQRPYDYFMPTCYSQYNLSKVALLCYIPYGYQFVKGVHMDIEYNDSLLNNLYFSFVDNDDSFIYVKEKSEYLINHKARKVLNLGYPRFDLLKELSDEVESVTTFLWLPRWSMDEVNDKSSFFDYFELLLDYFSFQKECNLVIRPHPLMFDNYIKIGLLTENQVIEIKTRVANIENVCFDTNTDYIETFKMADVLIADFTSLMIEFFVLKKPIIYCGNTSEFNNIGKKMLEGVYCVSSWSELVGTMDILKEGNDVKKNMYFCIADDLVGNKQSIGAAIANEIFEDYENSCRR